MSGLRLHVSYILFLILLFLMLSVQNHAQEAGEILKATGIKGGLVVHLSCGDGRLTAALFANDSYLVHGMDADAASVEKARAHVRKLGLYGKVSIDRLTGRGLPYMDNLVNLLVVTGDEHATKEEIMRVLAPKGVAYVKDSGSWIKTIKPRPKTIDDWPHYLHGPGNNAVARDMIVGPPRRMQWVSGPKWTRHHHNMSSISAMVSAGGRVFYIIDEGPTASMVLPPKWKVVARDAFSGVLLWKRPIGKWEHHLRGLKSGPADLPRRLVAVGGAVYATLGLESALVALDAATGKTIREYEGTKTTQEVILADGVLFLTVNKVPRKQRKPKLEIPRVHVTAVRADSGKILWQKEHDVVPLTLAVGGEHVVFHDGEKVICLDRKSGERKWASASLKKLSPRGFINQPPTLVLHGETVLFAAKTGGRKDGGVSRMHALSAATGKELWSADWPGSGYRSPGDILVAGGLVWTGATTTGKGKFTGRDPATGEVKAEFPPDVKAFWFHHRCHRGRATEKYLLFSRTGIEFVDTKSRHWEYHHWVRGTCLYGFMPANGLLYAPPHPCSCYPESLLTNLNALAPARAGSTFKVQRSTLEKGPAFGQIRNPKSAIQNPSDWPTYRHDHARSGFTKTKVPAKLRQAWATELGGRLSSPVCAGGKVFVAQIDTHTVHALGADNGKKLWSFSTGGRVDSPPTVYGNAAIFGCRDGWVYCLNADDGKLAWRFRAALADRRIVSYGQVESAWPVPGSVLVREGIVHCVAGRSMFLDGGMRLCRLEAATGKLLSESVFDDRVPGGQKNLQTRHKNKQMPVALPDVLSCDGKHIYMRSQQLDLEGKRLALGPYKGEQGDAGAHLFCPTGFLDDSWFQRSYWIYGRHFTGGYSVWTSAHKGAPAGRLLVFDDEAVYGFGRTPGTVSEYTSAYRYQLFACDKKPTFTDTPPPGGGKKGRKKRRIAYRWTGKAEVLGRGLVLAGDTLFIAGPPKLIDELEVLKAYRRPSKLAKLNIGKGAEALAGRAGGLLQALSGAKGDKLSELKLESPPVFDGMCAANGRLYISAMNGRIMCLSGE